MALPALPMPEPPIQGQIDRKKRTAILKRIDRSGSGGIMGGIANSGGGILDPNPTMKREDAWLGSTAMQNAQTAPQDPYSLLQKQLYDAVNSINVPGQSLEELRKLAEQQVKAQYDPQINALMAEMGAKGNRIARDQKTATDMYGGLAKDYLSQLPAITQQFAAEDAATNSRYDTAQKAMNDEYQANAAKQQQLMQQLGIQAAAPDAMAEAQNDNAYFNNQMETDQQASLNALAEQQMAQEDYTRNLGSNAKMAGANLYSDLGQQLEDYMTAANSQLGSLQSQRSSGIEALLQQMQSQQADQQAKERQQQFENQMALFNFQLAAQKASNAGGSGSSAGGFGSGDGLGGLTSGLQGATNYLASVYPNQPIRATSLMDQLNAVLKDPAVVNGKFVLEPGNDALGKSPKYSDVGQEYMLKLLRDRIQGKGSQFSNQDITAASNALEAYLGKLR